MKAIQKIISTEARKNSQGEAFYLSEVLLDDGETYSLASSDPPKTGDSVMAYFDERYGKPKASYLDA